MTAPRGGTMRVDEKTYPGSRADPSRQPRRSTGNGVTLVSSIHSPRSSLTPDGSAITREMMMLPGCCVVAAGTQRLAKARASAHPKRAATTHARRTTSKDRVLCTDAVVTDENARRKRRRGNAAPCVEMPRRVVSMRALALRCRSCCEGVQASSCGHSLLSLGSSRSGPCTSTACAAGGRIALHCYRPALRASCGCLVANRRRLGPARGAIRLAAAILPAAPECGTTRRESSELSSQ